MELRGRTLGGFVLEEGADGRYRARKDGAVVRVGARVAPDDVTAGRWLAAARAAQALDDPASARVLDAGVEEGRLVWVASELPEGTPLDELVRAGGPLPAARFVPLFETVCAAVARAHARGVAHGELAAERVVVSAATGRLAPRLSAFGAALLDEAATPDDDVAALAALARDVLDGGRALVKEDLAVAGPEALAAAIREATGLREAGPPPRLDEGLRARMLAEAPQPLAEAVAALDAAHGPEATVAAVRGVARVLFRYLAALALAARSRTGASARTDPGEVKADLRALRARALEDGEWLALARDLCQPFTDRPELHPVPALPTFIAAQIEPLTRLVEGGDLDSAVADLAAVLEAGRFLLEHALVVPHGDRAEVWMGIRRARPLTVPLGSPLPEGWPVILDPSGQPALTLYPLVQVAEPAPGEPAEVFLLAGPGNRGARLESLPSGAILDDQRLWSWFGENVAPMSAQMASVAIDVPPWRGLLPYGAEHAPFYFGRERESQALVNRLRVEPIVTVVGAAGAGKTSLVQAGVIPSLPRGWRALTVRPGASPLAALSDAVGDPALRAALAADPDALGRKLRAAAGDERLLLVLDPFEELFTRCADDVERQQAALCLARAARSAGDPIRLLCVVRDDYLVRVEGLPAWRERVARGLHVCATPPADDLMRALVEPAAQTGLEFEESAVPEALAAEAAPLTDGLARLSLLASLLWQRRVELKLPSSAARDLGGAAGILERWVADRLAALVPAERAHVPDLIAGRRDDPALAAKLTSAGLLGEDGGPIHEVLRPVLLERPPVVAPIEIPPPSSRMRALTVAGLALAVVGLAIALLRAGDRQRGVERARAAAIDATGAAERQLTAALVERGRRSLLAGDARAARDDLREAAARGARGEPLRLLAARAEAAAAGERLSVKHDGKIWMAGFSPDGTRLVTAGDDHVARLWDAGSGKLLVTYTGHTGTVWSARFSPDGARLITGGDDGAARIWTAATGELVTTLEGHRGAVLDAVLTGDGAVTFGQDGRVRVWSGTVPFTLDAVLATAFAASADGRLVAVGDRTGATSLYDLEHGFRETATLPGREEVLGVALSGDGRQVCTAGSDHVVRLWAAAGGKLLHEGRAHGSEVTGCAFSRDGTRVATTGADHTARVWDAASGDLLSTIPHRGEVSRALFSPDGTRLVTASSDGTARLWDPATGRPRGVLAGHEDSIWWVGWDPSGAQVVTASLDGTARVWPAQRDPLLATLSGHGDAIVSVRFGPGGKRVITASRDRTARIWDAAAGRELVAFPHDDTVRSAELSPDGSLLLTASKDGRARLFPAGGGPPGRILEAAGPLTCARFAPDGRRIATAEEHGPVTIWDAGSGARVATLAASGALDVRFAPAGDRLLVAGPGGAAAIWDLSSNVAAVRLEGHRLDVQAGGFSADGKRVVTASSDRTARVWDAATGATLAVLSGHTHELRHAEFSPSGALVVTAAGDGSARLWDAQTGALLDVLPADRDWVYGAAFSPDGGRVVTGGGDGTARVWDTRTAP